MKKVFYAVTVFAMVSCGGAEIEGSLTDAMNEAMEEVAEATETTEEVTEEATEEEAGATGTWKAWTDSYSDALIGTEVTLEGTPEGTGTAEDLDGNTTATAAFGKEGMMKCALTAHFSEDASSALSEAAKAGTVISFTGTVEEKSAFDGVVIKNCTINQ